MLTKYDASNPTTAVTTKPSTNQPIVARVDSVGICNWLTSDLPSNS